MSEQFQVIPHTPGPWKIRGRFDFVQDLGVYGGYYIGSTRGNNEDLPDRVKTQDEANARLIAAAPEMLTALKCVAEFEGTSSQIREMVLAVIQKTKGKT